MCALTYQTDLSVLRDLPLLAPVSTCVCKPRWGLSWRRRTTDILMTNIIYIFMTYIMYNVKWAHTEDNT